MYKRQIIGLVINTISALSVKELPEEELNEGEVKDDNEKYGMVPVSYTHLLHFFCLQELYCFYIQNLQVITFGKYGVL